MTKVFSDSKIPRNRSHSAAFACRVSLYDLCFLAGEAWEEQVEGAVGELEMRST
jgi:hypothetical protein